MKITLRISGLVSRLVSALLPPMLAAVLLAAGPAQAAGLGKLSVLTALGQPLRAEIELLSVQPDELGMVEVKLASPDAFRQARIERSDTLAGLRFSVDKRPNGQPVVRISSLTPVNDPFIDLLIELNWSSGRILREYTLLLDPTSEPMAQAEAILEQVKAPPVTEMRQPSRVAPLAKPVEPAPVAVKEVAKPAKGAAPKGEAMMNGKAEAKAEIKPEIKTEIAGTYGPVKSGETLNAIANKVTPPDVSVEMMVAALYRANPEAFLHDNMNLLKKGRTLNVPERYSIMKSSRPSEARKLVQEHSVAWRALQGRLADQAASAVETPTAADKSAGSGKIVQAAPASKPAAPESGKDVLRLSKGEPAKPSKADGEAAKRVQALETDLAARGRALQEAQSRVSQLEKTVQDLQRLIELKSKEPVKPAAPTPAAAEPKAPAVAPAPPAAPKLPPIEPAPTVEKKPAPKPPLVLPVEDEPGMLGTLLANPLYIGGIFAVILLGILLWVVAIGGRRRKGLTDFEQSIISGGDQFKTSIFKTGMSGTTRGGVATQSGVATDFSRLGLGAIDTHEVDPIAEAEVYMAYGRDAQAEEILKEALSKDPSRHEIALKLLEIYAARQDTATFETQASELYANLGDDSSPTWRKAAAMGRGIDPDNPLYRILESATAQPREPAPAPVAAAVAAAAAAAVVPPVVSAAVPEEEEIVEFDIPDFTPDNVTTGQAGSIAHDLAEDLGESSKEASLSEVTMDFNLDDKSNSFFAPSPAPAPAPAPARAAVPEELEFTRQFDMTAGQAEAKDEFDSSEPLDLGMGLMLEEPAAQVVQKPSTGAAPAPMAAPAAEVSLPDLDFSGIDLDMTDVAAAPAVGQPADRPPAGVQAPIGMDMDMDAAEEVNVKIDLAKAYVEMGDKDGAREILAEVLKEGNPQQQQLAGKIMAELV